MDRGDLKQPLLGVVPRLPLSLGSCTEDSDEEKAASSEDADGSRPLPQLQPALTTSHRCLTLPVALEAGRSSITASSDGSSESAELGGPARSWSKRFVTQSWSAKNWSSQSWSTVPLRRTTTAFMSTSSEFLMPKAELHKATEDRLRTFAFKAMRRQSTNESLTVPLSAQDSTLDKVLNKEWYKNQLNGDVRSFFSYMMAERFYYWYLAHICLSSILGAIAMVILDPTMKPGDAIFAAASSVTQSGLASLDWSQQSGSTHILSAILMLLGSIPLLSLVPVLLRRQSFQWQQVAEEEIESPRSDTTSPTSIYFQKVRARRDLEYRALGKVLSTVIEFVVVMHLLGFSFLLIHAYLDPDVNVKLKTLQIRIAPHAAYLSISAFQNNGLTLTPDSVEPFAFKPFALLVVGILILAGATCFPICIRLVVACKQRAAKKGSPDWEAYTFLLEHPRRCFTHLFPPVHTMWLAMVCVALLLMQFACIVQQNWDLPVFKHMTFTEKLSNSMFQAVSTRTAGLNSVDLPKLSAGTTFLFMVCMYISTSPTVVTMRFSVEQGAGCDELDITGRPEGCEEIESSRDSVRGQAKRYLTQHATYLILATFLVLCLERDKLYQSAEGPWIADDERMYGEFSTYKVMFEIISAYGTVGLSLGYPGSPASFSAAWSRESQLVLMLVAVLGRLRGLPDSIDPSVAFTMKLTGRSAAFMTATESEPLHSKKLRNSRGAENQPALFS